ncbi:MAG: hypothetical protein KDK37_09865, partial [Leptospiraceae bacterium]|nr:hypothetical protein [Leptospiraceae bacterium]
RFWPDQGNCRWPFRLFWQRLTRESKMDLIYGLQFLVLLFAGLLAGAEFVVHLALVPSIRHLESRAKLTFRRGLILKLRILIPCIFLPVLIPAIALIFLSETPVQPTLHYSALACLALWIALRIVGTVPINSATLEWSVESPPADWEARVARAERFHIVGVLAAVACFVLLLLEILPNH